MSYETGTMQRNNVTLLWAQIRGDLWVAPLGSLAPDVDMSQWTEWREFLSLHHRHRNGHGFPFS